MTTLTAHIRGQPDHCVHKLPSSCRLTALPICCACQDKRPHAPLYQKYIDGVGFVLRGRRQERYCWQCKVFWDKRVDDSGVPQSDTRIPETPDQTEFISKWFDWHRGFRSIHRADGTEGRQAMVGEALAEVDIGCLPRTITDLRNGLLESSDQMLIKARQRGAYGAQGQDSNLSEHEEFVAVPEEDRLFDPESPSLSAAAPVQARLPPREDNYPTSVTIDFLEDFDTLGDQFETLFNEIFAPHLSETTRIDLFDTQTHFPRFKEFIENLSPKLLQLFLLDLNDNIHTLEDGSAASMRRFITNQLDNINNLQPQGRSLDNDHVSSNLHPQPGDPTTLSLASRNTRSAEDSSMTQRLPQALQTSVLSSLNVAECQGLITQFEADLDRLRRRLGHLAPLGTQEDVQDPNYLSPVANMFNNYYNQHLQRQADMLRRQEAQSEQYERGPLERRSHQRALEDQLQSILRERRESESNTRIIPESTSSGRPRASAPRTPRTQRRPSSIPPRRRGLALGSVGTEQDPSIADDAAETTMSIPDRPHRRPVANPFEPGDPRHFAAHNIQRMYDDWYEDSSRLQGELRRAQQATEPQLPLPTPPWIPSVMSLPRPEEPMPSLDHADDDRPPPLEDADMMVRMRCAVCYSQVATIAVIPCGHCAMCKWCQAQAIPSHRADRTQPRDPRAKCPVCRRGVKKMVRIYGPEESIARRTNAGSKATNEVTASSPTNVVAASSASQSEAAAALNGAQVHDAPSTPPATHSETTSTIAATTTAATDTEAESHDEPPGGWIVWNNLPH